MPEDPFRNSLLYSARHEPERYVRQVEHDPTDYGAKRTASTWARIDGMSNRRLRSARQIAALARQPYGAIGVALRQRDGFGFLDPITEAGMARTIDWAYGKAPSHPLGLVLAGPTAPARGVRVEPTRPFGVELGERPEMRHTKLWRLFLVSLYGSLTDGVYPFGWEAPLAAKIRPAELDTEDSATQSGRAQAIVDPLGYVLDFIAAAVRTFERYQPPNSPQLALLLSMGRRDQEVVINGLHQDRRGESLASHFNWPVATRRACGGLVPLVEVAHPIYEEELLHEFEYRTTDGLTVLPHAVVSWLKTLSPGPEWEYLYGEEGDVTTVLLAGELWDKRSRRNVGRLVIAMPNQAPARLLAVPNELDTHGEATLSPHLGVEQQRSIVRVITAWAAENNFTGSCRRKTWFGWDFFSTTAANVDTLELAWRRGAAVRFWNLQFTADGPVDLGAPHR